MAELSKSRKRWILVATVLGSSLTFIDGSALGVALPAIQRDLGAVGSSRVDLQACKLEYSIVSPK